VEVVQQDRCRSSLNRKARRKSKMKILKKLKPEERGLTRTLWEQVFTEDTKEFLDYYYTEKTKNNEIYVIETDHDIRAMMQLNPYVIQMGKKAVESRYIVAVATEPLYRHRGYMAELLSKIARDLYQQKMPFFFLMPASEKIYYPHNYRFIYAADVWSAKGTDGKELTIQKIVELQNDSGVRLRKAEEKDLAFEKRVLSERDMIMAHQGKVTRILVNGKTIVTDLAKDYAKKYHIVIEKVDC